MLGYDSIKYCLFFRFYELMKWLVFDILNVNLEILLSLGLLFFLLWFLLLVGHHFIADPIAFDELNYFYDYFYDCEQGFQEADTQYDHVDYKQWLVIVYIGNPVETVEHEDSVENGESYIVSGAGNEVEAKLEVFSHRDAENYN